MISPRLTGMTALMIVVLFMLISSVFTNHVYAADEYDTLRAKWREMLTGGSAYNPQDSDISAQIIVITNEAQSYWDSMNKSPGRTYLWDDLKSTTNSFHVTDNYNRLKRMALSYSTKGSALENNSMLLSDTLHALDWMYTNRYNESKTPYNNWYDWQIGTPLKLNDITVLLYDHLTSTQITNYMNAVNHFTPTVTMTGANRVDQCLIIAVRGIIVKSDSKITSAKNGLNSVFNYVTTGDGFYTDGSFIQHIRHPYNGGYGQVLITGIGDILYLLSGSTWEVTSLSKQNVYKWAYDSYEPFVYKGAMMDLTRGRGMSRYYNQDHDSGHNIIRAIIRLSQSAPASDAAAYKSMVKHWIQTDTYKNIYESSSIEFILLAKEIMGNGSVIPRGELVKHQQFPIMDRAIHLRPGFGFGISMHSSRIYNYESINTENLKGWYMGDGMTYLYNNDIAQYSDHFWPTVNPYRLPGTTVDTKTRTNSSGQSSASTQNQVGGTSILGQYGISGMSLIGYSSNLAAKKSWFMFDNEIVAIGSDIANSGQSGNGWDGTARKVETIIENRKLNNSGNNALTVNGTTKSTSLGWSESMSGVNWAHLAGNTPDSDIGYYFPEGAMVKGLREARTGKWSDINQKFNEGNIDHTRNYMTLWFDHGTNPVNDNYSYVLLPNRTSTQLSNYASNPDIMVLENSASTHAVKEHTLNIVGVNFWTDALNWVQVDGTNFISSDKKASVMTSQTISDIEVAVSDPTKMNTGGITIEINKAATGTISKDASITVIQLSPTIKFTVNVNNAKGKTFKVKFDFESTDVILDENFNSETTGSTPSGWTVTGSGGAITVENVPSSGDKSMRINDTSGSLAVDADKTFAAQSGSIVVEFDARADLTSESLRTGYLYSGSTDAVLVYFRADGYISYYDGATLNSLQPYSANTWYHFKIIADASTNKYDIYIDDMFTPKVTQASFRNAVTSLDKIRFGSSEANTGKGYIDNVRIERIPLIKEDFNGGTAGITPSGWTVTGSGGAVTVENVPSSGDKSMRINDTSGSLAVDADKTFAAQSGSIVVEFDARADLTSESLRTGFLYSGSTDVVLVYFRSDGYISYYDSATLNSLQPYSANTWYHFKIIADASTNKYDIYIDDMVTPKVTQASFRNAATSLDKIRFGSSEANTGKGYIDNVIVYTE